MRMLYSYEGARREDLERSILRDIREQFGPVEQVGAHGGEGGLTTVTLELTDAAHGQAVIEALEARGDIVEAAQESYGEGA